MWRTDGLIALYTRILLQYHIDPILQLEETMKWVEVKDVNRVTFACDGYSCVCVMRVSNPEAHAISSRTHDVPLRGKVDSSAWVQSTKTYNTLRISSGVQKFKTWAKN